MKSFLFGAALVLTSWTPVLAATNVDVVTNSILQDYGEYCDPLYFEQHRPSGAQIDDAMVLSYQRVLMTRYGADCDHFFQGEVTAATMAPDLLARVPALRQHTARRLTVLQSQILGMAQRYDDVSQTECSGQPDTTSDLSRFRSGIEEWWTQLDSDDAIEFAKGYVSAGNYGLLPLLAPMEQGAVKCPARDGVVLVIVLTLAGNGITDVGIDRASKDVVSTPMVSPEAPGKQDDDTSLQANSDALTHPDSEGGTVRCGIAFVVPLSSSSGS